MDAEGRPRMLMLEVVEDLEGEVVVVRGVSGWRVVGGDEGGEGRRRECDLRHGRIMNYCFRIDFVRSMRSR